MFAFVSLNGNGYGFDQDFDILSFGDASDDNACGYWGCGTSYKNVVTVNGKAATRHLADGWTVAPRDDSLSAQWEHMVAVTLTGFEAPTPWPDGYGDYPPSAPAADA